MSQTIYYVEIGDNFRIIDVITSQKRLNIEGYHQLPLGLKAINGEYYNPDTQELISSINEERKKLKNYCHLVFAQEFSKKINYHDYEKDIFPKLEEEFYKYTNEPDNLQLTPRVNVIASKRGISRESQFESIHEKINFTDDLKAELIGRRLKFCDRIKDADFDELKQIKSELTSIASNK